MMGRLQFKHASEGPSRSPRQPTSTGMVAKLVLFLSLLFQHASIAHPHGTSCLPAPTPYGEGSNRAPLTDRPASGPGPSTSQSEADALSDTISQLQLLSTCLDSGVSYHTPALTMPPRRNISTSFFTIGMRLKPLFKHTYFDNGMTRLNTTLNHLKEGTPIPWGTGPHLAISMLQQLELIPPQAQQQLVKTIDNILQPPSRLFYKLEWILFYTILTPHFASEPHSTIESALQRLNSGTLPDGSIVSIKDPHTPIVHQAAIYIDGQIFFFNKENPSVRIAHPDGFMEIEFGQTEGTAHIDILTPRSPET